MINFGVAIGVALHSITYLSCVFPRVIHARKEEYEPIKSYFGKEQPENHGWFLKRVEGVTGITILVALVLALRVGPGISQYLFVILYIILIIHGLYLSLIDVWYEKTVSYFLFLSIPSHWIAFHVLSLTISLLW